MNIHLAPMEGIVDQHMRAILTQLGGYSSCVTEFIRVVDKLLPRAVFYRYCPELHTMGKTTAGVPVTIQLLGGIPEIVAINAQRAARLGAHSIDINFGCPSRFVNRNAGGAILLKEPQRIYDIVSATRKAVPAHIPVSAKIRLGYEDTLLALDNAHAVEAGGANFITVHARTKTDGYKPPAHWHWLATINEALKIPVIANGDIWNKNEYDQCYEISGCKDIMVGRGAIRLPNLAQLIKEEDQLPLSWPQVLILIVDMYRRLENHPGNSTPLILGRIKQWLSHLKLAYNEAYQAFNEVRLLKDRTLLEHWFNEKLNP